MLNTLNAIFPIRYTVLGLSVFALLLSVFSVWVFGVGFGSLLVTALLVGIGVYDLRQTKRSILRNYPIIGHLRFILEFVRPEIRQYFIESDNEATPFSRSQRSLVYQRAKGTRTSGPLVPSWMCMPMATSGSTTRCRPPRSRHTISASRLASTAPSPIPPVCSTSRP